MTVESKTVGYLTSRAYEHIGGSATVPTAIGNTIKNALGWAMRDLVFQSAHPAFRVEAVSGSGAISAVSGTADYDLASDFMMLIHPSFRHNSDPKETLPIMDMQEYDRLGGSKLYETNARPEYFSLIGHNSSTGHQQVKFIPTPDASYTIEYRYIAIPSDINASTTDATEIDVRFPRHLVEGIVDGALTRLRGYLETDEWLGAVERYRRAVAKMRDDAKPARGRNWRADRYRQRFNVVPAHRFTGLSGFSE